MKNIYNNKQAILINTIFLSHCQCHSICISDIILSMFWGIYLFIYCNKFFFKYCKRDSNENLKNLNFFNTVYTSDVLNLYFSIVNDED